MRNLTPEVMCRFLYDEDLTLDPVNGTTKENFDKEIAKVIHPTPKGKILFIPRTPDGILFLIGAVMSLGIPECYTVGDKDKSKNVAVFFPNKRG